MSILCITRIYKNFIAIGRGDTQVICSATIGPHEDFKNAERDSLAAESLKWKDQGVYLHYEFMPYSVNRSGRVWNMNFNRRAVGHSSLAERSLLMVMPSEETEESNAMRLTSEVRNTEIYSC